MIKNLDLNTLMGNVGGSTPLAGADQLLSLLGNAEQSAANSLNLNPEQIDALLKGAEGTEGKEFSDILNETNLTPKSKNSDLNLMNMKDTALTQEVALKDVSTSELELSIPKEVLVELNKLISNSSDNTVSDKNLEKILKEKPELTQLLTKVQNLNKEAKTENTKFSKLTKDLLDFVKETNGSKTIVNISQQVDKLNALTKKLGMTGNDLLKTKMKTKNRKVHVNIENQNLSKSDLIKKLNVENRSLIKPQQSIDNSQVSSEKNEQASKAMTLADLMFSDSEGSDSLQLEAKPNTTIKTNIVKTNSPILDMSQVSLDQDSEAVISQIKNYIIQSKVANEKNIDMSFNHKDLGVIDLNVSKMSGDALLISIQSHSAEAVKFFSENQRELMQTLTASGLQITDIKLESASSASKDFNFDENSFAGKDKNESQSKQRESEKESERRKELWELFDKEVA